MVKTNFEATYPAAVVAKYSEKALPATKCGHTAIEYIGPAIKTTVRAIGVQHFAVYAEPQGETVAEFNSAKGKEAFTLAVRKAEERGLPWMVSGGSDVFEPATGNHWSYHVPPTPSHDAVSAA